MTYFWSFAEANQWAQDNADGPCSYYVYPNLAIGTYWYDRA
jgi:hypothetical protein